MGETVWDDVKPGQRSMQVDDQTLLIYNGVPDWVRLPVQLGGNQVRVLGGEKRRCPCGGAHESLILILDEPTGIQVAECSMHGYLWFRPKKEGT